MFNSLMKFLETASKVAASPAGRAAIKAAPLVVRQADRWWSNISYEKAKKRLASAEYKDDAKVASILDSYGDDMSPNVRKAFEERLGR